MKSPDASSDLLQHALRCHVAGDLPAAESAFRRVLAENPNQVDASHYLGIIGLQTGRFDVAVEHIGNVIRLQPTNFDALVNLGNAQQGLGQQQKAIETFQRALKLVPDSTAVLANLGNAHQQQGRRAEAVGYLMNALDIDPTLTEARRNLADTLLDSGAARDALRHIRIAANADSQSLAVRASLANILHANGLYEDAISAYESILAAQPDFPPILCNLAAVLNDFGRTRAAIALLEKTTRLDPQYTEGHYALGVTLQHAGREEDADVALRRALSINPYCTKALRAIASSGRCDKDSEIRRDISIAMALPDLTAEQRLQLEFAAGKCDEDAGKFSSAARHLQIGNRLQRDRLEYVIEDDIAAFANIKNRFDREFILRRGNVGTDDPTPLFVVGMPRSGTSLIEQILASHSQVYGGGELLHFPQAIESRMRLRSGIDCTQSVDTASDSDLIEIAARYLSKLQMPDNTAKHVTDKLPGNFLHIGLIRVMFPNARIIHCVRDPRDTCWSIYKHLFGTGGHRYAYEQTELGKYYCAYEDLMTHWHYVLPGVIHDVRYEDLVGDQENTTRTLLDACDLQWDPACLDFYKTRRAVRTLSASQVRQPVYDRSIGAWKNVADELAPLLAALDPISDRRHSPPEPQ